VVADGRVPRDASPSSSDVSIHSTSTVDARQAHGDDVGPCKPHSARPGRKTAEQEHKAEERADPGAEELFVVVEWDAPQDHDSPHVSHVAVTLRQEGPNTADAPNERHAEVAVDSAFYHEAIGQAGRMPAQLKARIAFVNHVGQGASSTWTQATPSRPNDKLTDDDARCGW